VLGTALRRGVRRIFRLFNPRVNRFYRRFIVAFIVGFYRR
jgi:hypothetical protein